MWIQGEYDDFLNLDKFIYINIRGWNLDGKFLCYEALAETEAGRRISLGCNESGEMIDVALRLLVCGHKTYQLSRLIDIVRRTLTSDTDNVFDSCTTTQDIMESNRLKASDCERFKCLDEFC